MCLLILVQLSDWTGGTGGLFFMPVADTEQNIALEINKEFDPVRIGLISDTHIPADAKILPPHVTEAFSNLDLIIHGGDIYLSSVLDELEKIAPVIAALGNDDGNSMDDHRVKKSHVVRINGLSLGVTHRGYYPGPSELSFEQIMFREFTKKVDILVFGDTHLPMVAKKDDVLLVNPGSPTVPRGLYALGSVGILEITDNNIEASIIQLKDMPLPFDRSLIYYPGA